MDHPVKAIAAAVIREKERICICRRGPGGSCAGLWEFPGGKVEAGETPAACAERECREELGVDIAVGRPLDYVVHQYPEYTVAITFFEARLLRGSPQCSVHEAIAWVTPAELGAYDFCPADRDFIARIQAGEV